MSDIYEPGNSRPWLLQAAILGAALLGACGPDGPDGGSHGDASRTDTSYRDAATEDRLLPTLDGGLRDAAPDRTATPDGAHDGSCVPTDTCASRSWECGRFVDDCGQPVDCGSCPQGTSCNGGRCATGCEPESVFCLDATRAARCNASGNGVTTSWNCPAGTSCENGGCVGPIAWHLARSVDLQYVQDHLANGGLDTLDDCTDTRDDLAHLRLLCDVRRAVSHWQARFGLFYGTTWTTYRPDPSDPCRSSLDAWKQCLEERLRRFVHELHAASPGMLLSCSIAEYVHENNVPPGDWPAVCVPGTQGHWGPNTCIPDGANSTEAQAYFVEWGIRFLDAGCRAILFQQARLTFGGAPDSSLLTSQGAAALAQVLAPIQSHAATLGAQVYIGLQAAGGAEHSGRELADFVMGAQHLEQVGGFLLQPLNIHGPFFSSHYGKWDWHDANLHNNANGLPVLLDYDNFSSDPAVPDDIRLLASLADDTERARTFLDHWRHLHTYNPRAFLSVPLSKTLGNASGVTCYGMNQWQFSATKCGLLDAVTEVFQNPQAPVTVAAGQEEPIRRTYWGLQLLGRDETVSWLYRTFLERLPTAAEYDARLAQLPGLVTSETTARCGLAWALVSGSEYAGLGDDDADFVTKTYRAFLLREPDTGGLQFYTDALRTGSKTRQQVLYEICQSPEAASLYQVP